MMFHIKVNINLNTLNKFISTMEDLNIIRKFFLQNLVANEENGERKLFYFVITYIYIYV